MINLRTIVLGASTFVQGVLLKRHGARNFHTGQFEPNGKATVRVGGVESTAEGREGEFFKIASRAEGRSKINRPLGRKEWRFHFYPWHGMVEYRAPANDNTPISAKQHEYFDTVQAKMGVKLSIHQRRWYIGELENNQSGDVQKMWQEYPSTPAEC